MKPSVKSLNKDYKQLFKNFISLSSLQGIYYILPLITLPYLVRVLGTDQFGIWVYASNLISYFQTFTEYGFQLSATKEISLHRNNQKKIEEIFSAVIQIKSIFLIINFLILLVFLLIFNKLYLNKEIFILTFGMVIGQALFPIWLFQGIEKMSYITNLNFITKTLGTIAIFIFIKSSNDLYIVPLIYSSSSILLGILALLIATYKFKIHFKLQGINVLKYHLKEGWHIFISTFSVNVYIKSNIIILGFFANNTIIGQYGIVEKIILALRGISIVIFQTIYPFVCRLASESIVKLRLFFKRLFIPITTLLMIFTILIYILSSNIIYIIAGENISESTIILKILCAVPLIVILNIPFYQTLIALEKKKSYSLIMLIGSILNIVINVILAYLFLSYGTAISLLITEIFITSSLYYKYRTTTKILRLDNGCINNNNQL